MIEANSELTAKSDLMIAAREALPPGPYQEPPSPAEVVEFRKLIDSTGQPENLPGISSSKPVLDQEHRILRKDFRIDLKKRPEGDMIPCAFCCGQKPKCLTACLLWSADGFIRVIGHMCAKKYFGSKRFQSFVDAANAEEKEDRDIEFLLANLLLLPALDAELSLLEPLCKTSQDCKRKFEAGIPDVMGLWRKAVRENHSFLVVTERKASKDGPRGFRSSLGGEGETESDFLTIPVGRLLGGEFLQVSYSTTSRHRWIKKSLATLLATICRDGVTEETVLDAVADMSAQERANNVKSFRGLVLDMRKLKGRLNAFRAFISTENINSFQTWAQDRRNDDGFSVNVANGNLTIRKDWRNRVTLRLPPPIRVPRLKTLDGIDL